MIDAITAPEWERTYYQTDTGGRTPVHDPDGSDERQRVATVLAGLHERGMLPTTAYDEAAFDRLRAAVRQHFDVPWTSITPVMERLLFAICAIKQPRAAVCLGVFCGNTLVWNVGALTGPGQCATADVIVGSEVVPQHVELARRNFAAIGAVADIRLEDGHDTVQSLAQPIDLLYLDATGPQDHPNERHRGKRIYSSLLETAYPHLADGAIIVAHDTVPEWFPRSAPCYFALCRDRRRFRASVEVRADEQGIEVTCR